MKVLGIDPGFEKVGIAIVEQNQTNTALFYSTCFKTLQSVNFNERLFLIGKEINRVIKKYKPDALSIETLFFNTNQKTALRVSETRGVIIYESKKHNLTIYEYTPLQIKNAITGYGRADKNQVNNMVKQLIFIPDSTKKEDDEMDAIAAALTCLASYKAKGL